MKFAKITLILTALFAFSVANSHVVWLEPTLNKDEYVVKFGHKQTETYPADKLKSVQLVSPDGTLKAADYQFKQSEAYFKADQHPIVFLHFDNGIWSKLPSGKYVEKSKRQEPAAEFSTNTIKLGKAILDWNEQAFKAHNMAYELIPQTQALAGKPLRILVLHNGKPVAGVKLGQGEGDRVNLTDAQGMAEFIPNKGFNKVWAEFTEYTTDNPDYDRRSIEYMLTFDVKE